MYDTGYKKKFEVEDSQVKYTLLYFIIGNKNWDAFKREIELNLSNFKYVHTPWPGKFYFQEFIPLTKYTKSYIHTKIFMV